MDLVGLSFLLIQVWGRSLRDKYSVYLVVGKKANYIAMLQNEMIN